MFCQHSNSRPVCMTQNDIYFGGQIGKECNIFCGVLQNSSNEFMAVRRKRLGVAGLGYRVFFSRVALSCEPGSGHSAGGTSGGAGAQRHRDPAVPLAYLCLVLYFVGSLLKLANLPDNVGYLWGGREFWVKTGFSQRQQPTLQDTRAAACFSEAPRPCAEVKGKLCIPGAHWGQLGAPTLCVPQKCHLLQKTGGKLGQAEAPQLKGGGAGW